MLHAGHRAAECDSELHVAAPAAGAKCNIREVDFAGTEPCLADLPLDLHACTRPADSTSQATCSRCQNCFLHLKNMPYVRHRAWEADSHGGRGVYC